MTSARRAPSDTIGDGELVLCTVAGDTSAFAAIYDRYADRLFDFCVGMLGDRDAAADCVQDVFVTAATRLGQLNDPDRLKSWLYAIARNEALARIRARRREHLSDILPEKPSAEPGPDILAARSELAELITAACGGLSDRDRVVLELAYRHGLDGGELADALGVTHHHAHTLMARVRDNMERSLGALLVCRGARSDANGCPELAALVQHWDGRFTVLMRKRVARHIDGCAVCEVERRRRVSPVALLGGAPLFMPAPARLRQPTLSLVAQVTPLPPAPAGAPPGAGPAAGGGRGVAAGSGGPPSSTPGPSGDWAELPAQTHHGHRLGGHLRLVLLIAVLLAVVLGGVVWGAPLIYRVWPAATSVPGTPVTTPAKSSAPASVPVPSTPAPPSTLTTPTVSVPAPAVLPGAPLPSSARSLEPSTPPPPPPRPSVSALPPPETTVPDTTIPTAPTAPVPSVSPTPQPSTAAVPLPTPEPPVVAIPTLAPPTLPAGVIPTPGVPNVLGGGSSDSSTPQVPPNQPGGSTGNACPPILQCAG